jgi:hypothetical protein
LPLKERIKKDYAPHPILDTDWGGGACAFAKILHLNPRWETFQMSKQNVLMSCANKYQQRTEHVHQSYFQNM